VDDPTTIALNLTFIGTIGIAFVMFVGLIIVIVLTLVLAGVGRLASLILLALVGIFPKRDTVEIVRLPSQPEQPPATLAEEAAEPGPPFTARIKAFYMHAGAWLETAWSSVRQFKWKSALDARKLPKPSQVKDAVSAGIEAGVETQAKHHPFVVAAKHEPHALSPKWAAAVAAADERAAERAKAAAPPEIVVTVRDLPPAEAPAEKIEKVAPLVESAVDPHGPRKAAAKVTSGAPRA